MPRQENNNFRKAVYSTNFGASTKSFNERIKDLSIEIRDALETCDNSFKKELKVVAQEELDNLKDQGKILVAFVNCLTNFHIQEIDSVAVWDAFKDLFNKEKFFEVKYLILNLHEKDRLYEIIKDLESKHTEQNKSNLELKLATF